MVMQFIFGLEGFSSVFVRLTVTNGLEFDSMGVVDWLFLFLVDR